MATRGQERDLGFIQQGLTIFTWILQILIGFLFLFAGASKLVGVEEMVNFFAQVGFWAVASLLPRSSRSW